LSVADNSITTGKIEDAAVTAAKQTITTYYKNHNAQVIASGETETLITEFVENDVPAGDVSTICTFLSRVPDGAVNHGTIKLLSQPGDVELGLAPMHLMTPGAGWVEYTMHGRISNFSGGTLTLDITAFGANPNTEVEFGTNDTRWARKCTVVAGQ
jgi:hypothetical protein